MPTRTYNFCRDAKNAILYFHKKEINIEDIVEKTAKLVQPELYDHSDPKSCIDEIIGVIVRETFSNYESKFNFEEEQSKLKRIIPFLANLTFGYSQRLGDSDFPKTNNIYHFLAEKKLEEREASLLQLQEV